MTQDCVFCKIINGEIPCYKIAENAYALAFLDVSCDCYGHTLVVPKKHFNNIMDCEEVYMGGVAKLIKKVANYYVEFCGFEGVNVLNNSGAIAGQTVNHLHFHIIPRKKYDSIEIKLFAPGENTSLEDICKKLVVKEDRKKVSDEKAVILYSDGACSNNPGIGGFGTILQYNGKEKIITGGEEDTTNNRMELMGVIKGLQAIKDGMKVEVFTDSAYVVNAFEQDWIGAWKKNNWRTSAKTPVQNMELWKALIAETERLVVNFNKVKGHANDEINNRCDELARAEVQKIKDEMESRD